MNSLATSKRDRTELFRETASRRRLNPAIIEKDFWVCWTLKQLFAIEELGQNLIFKGGTSLSKIYGIIHRFSEDIDLSIQRDYLGFSGEADPERGVTKSQRKKSVDALREKCRQTIREVIQPRLHSGFREILGDGPWSLAVDSEDTSTLLFAYPIAFAQRSIITSYVRPVVRLEMGAGSDSFPVGSHPITPYAAEDFPQMFHEPSCTVRTLAAERTFWEKATILHAHCHLPSGKPWPARLSRHYYDLAQLAESEIGARALADITLLQRVVAHKSVYFASGWASYQTAQPGTFCLSPRQEYLGELQRDYARMSDMFFGDYPAFDDLLLTIQKLENRINTNLK